MGFTGYTATLPDDVLLDSGVFFVGPDPLGVTVGGIKFDEGREERQVAFDGARSEVEGLAAIVRYTPVLSSTMLQFTETNIERLAPGSTSAVTGGAGAQVTTITPKPAGQYYAAGDYIDDLRAIYKRKNGKYAAVLFPKARCRKWDLQGADNAEVPIAVEFVGVLPANTPQDQLGKAPYVIELRDALPV